MRATENGYEAAKRLASLPTTSSGSAALDGLLGGGYRAGRVVEIFGASNTGKTQLGMQAVLCAARARERGLFIDSEGTFRPERLERMAAARGWEPRGLLDRIEYVRVTTAAQQIDVVRAIRKHEGTSSCRMVVIDTLTKNFTLDYPGSANVIRRQGVLDVHLSEVARDAFIHGRAYLLTNRVTFAQAGGETRIGGHTTEQLVHASLHVERSGRVIKATRLEPAATEELGEIGDGGLES